MKVKCHFAIVGLSNTFLIGDAKGGPAIMVDPSRFDIPLLKMIEDNNYYIKAVMVTHNHENHIRGLLTMRKIYDFEIWAGEPEILGFKTKLLDENKPIDCCGFTVEPMKIRGHSADSYIFKIRNTLFTGDLLSAGRIGTTNNSWTQATMYKDLAEKVNILEGNTMIFPGHGPPSTLKIERETNPAFNDLSDFTLEGAELENHENEFEI